MAALEAALFIAESVRDAASRACEETVGGFNGSLACIATDAVYVVAKAAHQTLAFCDADIDSAEIEGSYNRLAHIHENLETSMANDGENTADIINTTNAKAAAINTNIDTEASSINSNIDTEAAGINTNIDTEAASINSNIDAEATAINNNVNAQATLIIAKADSNTALIIANTNSRAAEIKAQIDAVRDEIIANDDANTAAIIASDNANKNELRDLILRTQIEADLATADNATPLGLYLTPGSVCSGGQCGRLDLVRDVVAQTLANIQAAGESIGGAQKLLDQGDALKAAGQFKAAYQAYRKAYKTAVK